jgi:hypothetical protein
MRNDFATVIPSMELLYVLRRKPNCLDDLDAPDLIFEHPTFFNFETSSLARFTLGLALNPFGP